MLDPKKLRSDFDAIAEKIQLRGGAFDFSLYHKLEEERKALQVQTQELQAERNKRSKEVGMKKSKGEDVADMVKDLEQLRETMTQKEQALNELLAKQEAFLLHLPNVPHNTVPVGKDENSNKEVRVWGEKKTFDFEPRDHVSLGEMHKGLNFEQSAAISGSRFVVMHHHFARLHRALAQWMLDLHTQRHGYQEVNTPLLVEEQALYGAGQLPKFKEDLFHLQGERKLSLIPTAEVTLVNLVKEQILEANQLPIKFTAHTPCFRSEAGSYGKDTRGMFRVHQFEKVEMVQIVHPEKSYEALEEMTRHAETVLQNLQLPYRVMSLCTGDMGFCASKTYDLEVWLPGQNRYREISSCSNTEDFQARRLKARFRDTPQGKPELVHTLNGSGVAVGRAFIAIIENYQKANGDIEIPEVLVPYMHGMTVIKAP